MTEANQCVSHLPLLIVPSIFTRPCSVQRPLFQQFFLCVCVCVGGGGLVFGTMWQVWMFCSGGFLGSQLIGRCYVNITTRVSVESQILIWKRICLQMCFLWVIWSGVVLKYISLVGISRPPEAGSISFRRTICCKSSADSKWHLAQLFLISYFLFLREEVKKGPFL